MNSTRLHTALGAFLTMVLANGKAAQIADRKTCRTCLGMFYSMPQILCHTSHNPPNDDRVCRSGTRSCTAGTCLAWGANSFLIAMLTTRLVTTVSTGESRSRCTIKIDEIAALDTLHPFSRKIRELLLLLLGGVGHDSDTAMIGGATISC